MNLIGQCGHRGFGGHSFVCEGHHFQARDRDPSVWWGLGLRWRYVGTRLPCLGHAGLSYNDTL